MEKFKKNLGITLIALVITIVILLILAAITIGQLQNSGLFNKTQVAKETYTFEAEQEQLELEIANLKMQMYLNNNGSTTTLNDLKTYLESSKFGGEYLVELFYEPMAATEEVQTIPVYAKVTHIPTKFVFYVDGKLMVTGGESNTEVASNRDVDVQQLKNQIKQELMQEMSTGDGNPTGTVIAYYGNTAPSGYLKCDGTTYNISEYSNLAALINTTTGSYGTDESGKFKVPNLVGKFLKGNTSAGENEEAGLPNITGTLDANIFWSYGGNDGAGAFSSTSTSFTKNYGGSSSGSSGTIKFDAKDSNQIYGKSETVTPENVSVIYCIKY